MKVPAALMILILVLPGFVFAQDGTLAAENPLAVLKLEVERVLEEAALPFSDAQEDAIILMMEDRRQASEELFGDLMDFSAGPTQGQASDRLRSAIEYMENEFLARLEDYLTAPQLAAWSLHLETTESPVNVALEQDSPQQQTQYVRLNPNVFTAEEGLYRIGGGPRRAEVIERGGAGAFHGNAQFLIIDESLNAGRRSYNRGQRVPTVKPPYQERDTSFDISGPVLPGRLTMSFAGRQNEAENVDTINATLANGSPFSSEIVRPTTHRFLSTGGTYQFADAHSLTFNLEYAPYTAKNQGIGGFVLPERAWASEGHSWIVDLKQFSSLSARSIYEMRFQVNTSHAETIPTTTGVRTDVVDAFSSGGSGNRTESDNRNYEISNLYTRIGEGTTLRFGFDGIYRKNKALSTANFDGTFTFSSLDDFNQGRPFQYRVAQGEPLLETTQTELAFFMQNDWRLTPELTFYYGFRYDWQTNLDDADNFGPRLGLAYALGQATVIRSGLGVFYSSLGIDLVENQRRLDGTRQFETVIAAPSYPDPFNSGTVQNLLPSVRVTDPTLSAPYASAGLISIERTFLTNLFVSATYEYLHEVHRLRFRDLNAPRDITSPVPRSCTKDQSAETCVRPDPTKEEILNLEATMAQIQHSLRFIYRQRFSIFNVSANYQYQRGHSDGRPNAAGFLPSDPYDLQADWARARFFPTNTLASTINAQLPLGIFLTGTLSANSGPRFNITTGTDDNQDGHLTDRPPGIPRNAGDAPKFVSFGFNISKAFFFEGTGGTSATRTNLNVFANITNAFNNVNFSLPSGVMTSPNFGLSTSAQDPRLIEIGLRFQF